MSVLACGFKHDYRTKGEAIAKARKLNPINPMRAYKCPHCGNFHLTRNLEKPREEHDARSH